MLPCTSQRAMGATLSLSSAVELVPLMTPLPAPPPSTGNFFDVYILITTTLLIPDAGQ